MQSSLFPADKQERQDIIIAITVVVLIFGAVLYYLSGNNGEMEEMALYDRSEQPLVREDYKDEQVLIPEEEPATKERTAWYEKEETSVEETTDPLIVNWVDSMQQQEIDNTDILKEVPSKEKEISPPVVEKNISPKPDPLPMPEKAETVPTPKEKVEKRAEKPTALKPAPSAEERCIIMLGAFKDGENVYDLERRLRKDQLPVYAAFSNGYRVVGVYSECRTEKLQPLLQTLRRQYNSEAWVLNR